MSTKAIRKLIHQARMGITTHRTCREALAELEGIEKAARVLAVDGPGTVGDNPTYRAWADAMTLLGTIANEHKP